MRVEGHELRLAGELAVVPENGLMAGAMVGYGLRVGICMVMVRRARLRAVAPGMGLAPAR